MNSGKALKNSEELDFLDSCTSVNRESCIHCQSCFWLVFPYFPIPQKSKMTFAFLFFYKQSFKGRFSWKIFLIPLWFKTAWFPSIYSSTFPWVREWARERCEQTNDCSPGRKQNEQGGASEWVQWSSAYIAILDCSEPLWFARIVDSCQGHVILSACHRDRIVIRFYLM